MKAVIYCGGQGTRLREETEFKPKPLVEVGGMPILWHIMKIYAKYGYKEFILPLGYRGDLVKEFFINFNWRANDFTLDLMKKKIEVHENHKNEGWVIHFVDTGLETKTALRLKKVKHLLEKDETFLLTYGDGLADIDLKKLVEFHKKQKRIATITGVRVSSRFGTLNVEGSSVKEFREKPREPSLINGGFMVFDSKVFDYISDKDVMLESPDGPLTKLSNKGQVSVYPHLGFWHCMDTYRDYLSLNKIWKEDPKWKVWK